MENNTAYANLKPIEYFHENIHNRLNAESIALNAIYQLVTCDREQTVCAQSSVAVEDTLVLQDTSVAMKLAFKDRDFRTAYLLGSVMNGGLVRLDRAVRVRGEKHTLHRNGFIMNTFEDNPFEGIGQSVGFDMEELYGHLHQQELVKSQV